jgi:uncharacterized membrane protein YcaP (DUF421 family)
MGRRHLGQMTVVDLVVVIVLGSAVETAMVGGNTSLPVGLVSAATLFGTNRLLTAVLSRFPRVRSLVLGSPMVLVHHGKVVEEQLRRVGVTRADVLQAIRERGVCELDEVKFAVLELDGAINVIPRTPETTAKARSDSASAT